MNTPAPVSPVPPVQGAKPVAHSKHAAGKQEPGKAADAFSALMEALAGTPQGEGSTAAFTGSCGGQGEDLTKGMAGDAATGKDGKEAQPDAQPAMPWPPQLAMHAPIPLPAPMQAQLAAGLQDNAGPSKGSANAAAVGVDTQAGTAAKGSPQQDALQALLPARDATPGVAADFHKALSTVAADVASPARTAATPASIDSQPLAPAAINLPTMPAPASPATVVEATLQSRPGEPAFANELAAQVSVMVQGEVHSARLELNPAELGPIRIDLNLQGGNADISFAAAHAGTREGIEQALPELRELLAQQGVQLGEAGISSGAGQHWAQQHQQQQHQQQAARDDGGQRFAVPMAAGRADPTPGVAITRVRAPRGALDLYA